MGYLPCLVEYLKVTNGVAGDIFTALEIVDEDMGFSIIMGTPDVDLTRHDKVIRIFDFKEFKVGDKREISFISDNGFVLNNTLYSLQETAEEAEFSYMGRI